MKKIVCSIICAVMVFAAAAQEGENKFLDIYDQQLIHVGYNWGSGMHLFMNSSTAVVDGRPLDISIANRLNFYPESRVYYEQYKDKFNSSNWMVLGGVAIALAPLLVLAYIPETDFDAYGSSLVVGEIVFAAAGLTIEVMGLVRQTSAVQSLFYAVEAHNRAVILNSK